MSLGKAMICQPKKFGFLILLFCLQVGLETPISVNAQQIPRPLIKSETTPARNVKIFDELWAKVNDRYFDPKFGGADWARFKELSRPQAQKAESKEALILILRQILSEIKTSHLAVWIAVSEKQLERKIGENFDSKRDWIRLDAGFDTKTIEGRQVVTDVEKNSSAETAGVRTGWTLIAVDNKLVSRRDWGQFIESREGQQMDYRFLDHENKERHLVLTTGYIVKKFVRIVSLLQGNVGYLKFASFTPGTGDWLRQELAKLKHSKAVIVDLRGNRGGLIDEVKSSLRAFFVRNVEFGTLVERSGKIREPKIKGSGDSAFAGKVIVLVDEDTGSGSEIFTSLIQENGRGEIVGTRTRGRVLNSIQFDLSDNFELLVPVRDYLSPRGARLEGVGVRPDTEVDLTVEDIRLGRDRVLSRAIKIAE